MTMNDATSKPYENLTDRERDRIAAGVRARVEAATQKEVERVLEMENQKAGVVRHAKSLGFDDLLEYAAYVRRLARGDIGATKAKRHRTVITPAVVEKVKAAFELTQNYTKVARELGIAKPTVFSIVGAGKGRVVRTDRN